MISGLLNRTCSIKRYTYSGAGPNPTRSLSATATGQPYRIARGSGKEDETARIDAGSAPVRLYFEAGTDVKQHDEITDTDDSTLVFDIQFINAQPGGHANHIAAQATERRA